MKIQLLIFLALLIPLARADLVFSEIMYDPEPISDTDLEWIEFYNNGTRIDLVNCKIDGSNFDDVIIEPYEFIIVARELIDGTDEDLDSFESYYGNNDNIWDINDGNYKAVDGSFSLTDDDTILVECPDFNLEFNYTGYGIGGTGYSMEKINLNNGDNVENWRKGIKDGTPGYYDDSVDVSVEITENVPEVLSFRMYPDDLEEEGIQILPLPNQEKRIYVEINTTNGIKNAEAKLNTEEVTLEKNNDVLTGYFDLNYDLKPGNYTIKLNLTDTNDKSSLNELKFEYLPLLASSLDTRSLDFGKLRQGFISETKNIKIKNTGNVDFDIEVYGTDLSFDDKSVGVSSLEFYFDNIWNGLTTTPSLFGVSVDSGNENNLDFRINVPNEITPGVYNGKVNVVAVGK
ncbi:MAG: hypothetical protein PHT54_02945 [Candidatus Nanoarchaeia archaeon]|nr:hypothetical protein [Candidatus Nanoarchaeia archaeon]